MTKIKIPAGTSTYVASVADTTYLFAQGKTISASGYGIDATAAVSGRTFEIDGSVYGSWGAIAIGMSSAGSPAVTLNIGKHGQLTGSSAVLSYGDGHVVHNAGTIDGNNAGVEIHGAQTVINTGKISGFNAVNIYDAAGDITTVKNSGTIATEADGKAIYGSLGNERIVNTGTILGDIDLGGGDDTFLFKSGKVNGSVAGGLGNDLYTVHKAGLDIVEKPGEGIDTVKSSVTFVLGTNVDSLQLLGKHNIDGIGNGDGNILRGNDGKNELQGWAGSDMLNGGKGNDILAGGAGNDIFVFDRGTGKDVITDYEKGGDNIYLGDLKGHKDFDDMVANHIDEKANGDLWITYGHDTVVIKDTDIDGLNANDFWFGAS